VRIMQLTIEKLKQLIKEHVKELSEDWAAEPGKNHNHMASRIGGEIDGMEWVLNTIVEHEEATT